MEIKLGYNYVTCVLLVDAKLYICDEINYVYKYVVFASNRNFWRALSPDQLRNLNGWRDAGLKFGNRGYRGTIFLWK